jgi:hypothetical protein
MTSELGVSSLGSALLSRVGQRWGAGLRARRRERHHEAKQPLVSADIVATRRMQRFCPFGWEPGRSSGPRLSSRGWP